MRIEKYRRYSLTTFAFVLSLLVLVTTIYIGGGSAGLAFGMGFLFTLPITMLTNVAEGLAQGRKESQRLEGLGFMALGNLYIHPKNREVTILHRTGERMRFHMDDVASWQHKISDNRHWIEFEINDDYRTYTLDALIDNEANATRFSELVR